MKDMKIKINPDNVVAVRQALEKLGYNLAGVTTDANYYYTYVGDSDVYYGNSESIFERKTNEEYFLISGVDGLRFIPLSYWTQPETKPSFTIYGPNSEQFKKAQKDLADKTTYEPLPEWQNALTLKPRSEFLHERNVNILNVMLEYVTEGKRIPDNMISELGKNNEEIYNV